MTRTGPAPCPADEAVERARRVIGKGGQYLLGTGDYRPNAMGGTHVDLPWTPRGGELGSDCAGFAICWCYKLVRHRPGYARGRVPDEYRDQSDVDDDINCNSLLEDAFTAQELCFIVESGVPVPGDLLVYPSLRLTLKDGSLFKTIGHVGIVIGNSRLVGNGWSWQHPAYHLLDIAQCKGPDGRSPAVIQTDGSIWAHHDAQWPKPAHRSRVVRMKP